MGEKYYLGLDIGTSSVGWAVTDDKYNILRRKGKDLWGARLFTEANTAAERRTKRIARRRLEREHYRNSYLKSIFESEINGIDPGFFQRLEDSKFFEEDKMEKQPYTLFADKKYTDKDFHRDYPTVFHLISELIKNKEQHDIRLVFLALLNIYKHRGHFLNAGSLSDEVEEEFEALYINLISEIEEQNDETKLSEKNVDAVRVKEILSSREISKTKKSEELLKIYGLSKTKDKPYFEMFKLLTGLSAVPSKIFKNEEYDEETKKISISFQSASYDEDIMKITELFSDEVMEIIESAKKIHDLAMLEHIMHGKRFLCEARIESYEKHKSDLEILKNLYRQLGKEKYDSMFRVMKDNNYSAYVGSVNSNGNRERRGGKRKQVDLYTIIKKEIKELPDSSEKPYVLEEIEKENFLPKQLTSNNGVIPYQLHLRELKAVLKNAKVYLPFLTEKDSSGLTAEERIIQMFEFQIPYYVGTLTGSMKQNDNPERSGWSIRKKDGKIYPWNFEEMIDTKESAERFINNMVNCCTYISNDKVLPKNSLLYEKFLVLNELNNLKINDEKPSVELKQKIFNSLFKTGKKVTKKRLISFLRQEGIIGATEEVNINGIDNDFANKRANYAKFTAVLQVETLSYEQEKMVEKIIYWSTIYGDSKKFLKEKIEDEYKGILSKEQIKRILGYKFNDWGRLSASLLNLEGADKETGEIATVISRMWNENKNLIELIATDTYTYKEDIEKQSQQIDKNIFEITHEDIEDLYASAPVKRMIWQTVLIVKEITKIMKCAPKKIFIEMTRHDDIKGEKGRKNSRKKMLEECLKNCKDDQRNWGKEVKDKEESDFRSKKLFLYYTQLGRDMYTNEAIDLDKLFLENEYDIDHIYPRSILKDDSIHNNLVLVKKTVNHGKSDTYPIKSEIRHNQIYQWKHLRDLKLITEEKYRRLTRNTEITDSERANFISRQLVETGQATKAVATVFKNLFNDKDTEIVYSKAGNVSDFRKKFDLLKCRGVNNFHHAQDAYLNIVVGNVYNVKFTKHPAQFVKEWRNNPKLNHYHMDKMFEFDVQRGEEFAWHGKDGTSIATVKKMMSKNTPLITRRTAEVNGEFYNATIISAKAAGNKEGYISVKSSEDRLGNIEKYGGYGSIKGAYFFLVEHRDKKGNKIRTIEDIPVYLKDVYCGKDKLQKYCEEYLSYTDPKVIIDKINHGSLVKINGFLGYITGKSNDNLLVSSAVEMKLSKAELDYIRVINKTDHINDTEEKLKSNGVNAEKNIMLYDVLKDKHLSGIYSRRPNPAGTTLEHSRNLFLKLNLKEQVFVIQQILRLSSIENQGIDLRLLGESQHKCKAQINKKISALDEAILIKQSITGIYEDQIDLLTV